MIGKILKSTKGKPCSCPPGKICTHCKKINIDQSQKFIDEPRRFQTPLATKYHKPSIGKYKHNSTVQYFEKPRQWKTDKNQKYETKKRKSSPICRWYKRRKALKELVAEYEKERKDNEKRQLEEYERERIENLIYWENKKRKKSLSPTLSMYKWVEKPEKKLSLRPAKKKVVYVKETSAIVKPRAKSKSVSAKKSKQKESLTRRFSNYCYRFCCQLYCYLTCIILIIIIIIFFV